MEGQPLCIGNLCIKHRTPVEIHRPSMYQQGDVKYGISKVDVHPMRRVGTRTAHRAADVAEPSARAPRDARQ
jgi:hypothetical protein